MATTTYQLESSDFVGLQKVNDGLRMLAEASRQAASSIAEAMIALQGAHTIEASPYWATERGEWPDKFTLLNRYLRTGVKPPFLFNE